MFNHLKERINWRIVTNIWTIIAFLAFSIDFFSFHKYSISSAGISIIYIAILTLYAGTKEFDRWLNTLAVNYKGEVFVIVWTFFIIILSLISFFSAKKYNLPSELVTVYITVLGIFALTRRSKYLYHRRKG